MNIGFLSGRLTKDPEVFTTPSGMKIASFTIVNDEHTDANKNKVAQFFNVKVFDKRAEFVANYFGKGRKILITYELSQHKYETRDGQKRDVVELITKSVEFMDSKPTASESAKPNDLGTIEVTTSDLIEVQDDDLPF